MKNSRYALPFHFSTRIELNSNSMPLISSVLHPLRDVDCSVIHFAELYHKIPGWQGLCNHKKRRPIPLSSQGMGHFSKEGLPRPRGHSPMLSILSSIVPAGAFTSTVSPALWPIRACPIGDFMEILPSCMLASCGLVRV